MNFAKIKENSSDKNNWRTVILVFLFVAVAYLILVASAYISTFIGTAYNPTNPNIYQFSNEITYNYRNGTKGEYS